MSILIIVAISATGCVGPSIFNSTPRPQFDQPILTRIVLADATYDKNVIIENKKPFFAAVERGLRDEIRKTNLMSDLVFERDMSPKGYGVKGGRVYLIRYRATDFKETVDPSVWPAVLVCLIITMPFAGLVPPDTDTVWMTFDMKIYDVSTAPIVRVKDTTSEEYLNIYDTADFSPIHTQTYKVKVAGSGGYSKSEERIEWSRAMAADLSRQLIRDSAEAIKQTVKR